MLPELLRAALSWKGLRHAMACLSCGLLSTLHAAEPVAGANTVKVPAGDPPWKAMDYGPFFSATLEVAKGNIANKGIAIRLDPGPGGVANGREFFLFDTDTLRAAAGWTGPGFIDWRNVAMDGAHEVHPSIVGNRVFTNPDAPGWADPEGAFSDQRIVGKDDNRYGPLPREWAHWRGLYVHDNQVILSYTVGQAEVLESPAAEGEGEFRALARTFQIGSRTRPLILQVSRPFPSNAGEPAQGPVILVGGSKDLQWLEDSAQDLRLKILPGSTVLRFKLLFPSSTSGGPSSPDGWTKRSPAPADLAALLHGGAPRWTQSVTTKVERLLDPRSPYAVEGIGLPMENPYRSWMRLGGFDFFKDSHRAAVCTWQGDVWTVDGLGEPFGPFDWKRIASGLFQPLGLKIVDDKIFLTCRDQITVLRDLNGDGETDFYENFNNDAQVTEHFHEFAMDLQTDRAGNFYYAKAGRHAKDALVPQHGTLLQVTKDGSRTTIMANGFRAPNGVCVNEDGSFIVSDQEGHWTPENRINWIKPGGFYGYMMGFHDDRAADDFEPPLVWIHKSLDRSPAEQLWVASDSWGLPRGTLLSLSYGTGKILGVLAEKAGVRMQGGVFALPIPALPTGIMRGRFHPTDGQLYTAGLFGWAGDKTRAGGFYRIRYNKQALHLPIALRATRQGMLIEFTCALDPASATDPENYAVARWTYRRTANYGSDDYKVSDPNQRGRDSVQITGARLSPDKRSVLLLIPDLQPCMQMEIKCGIRAEDGTKVAPLIENTIHAVEGDCPF